MKASKSDIRPFLQPGKIALAGASGNEKKFGNQLYKLLTERGYEVYPVNPNTEQIGNKPCYASVSLVPGDVKFLVVVTPKNQTSAVVDEALAKGFEHIWIQQMSDTPEVVEKLKDKKVNTVFGECMMMYIEPVKGAHRFHRFLRNIFGRMPK